MGEIAEKKKTVLHNWTGVGLVFGTAIGALILAFTKEPWHMGSGMGVGLVIGAVFGSHFYKQNS